MTLIQAQTVFLVIVLIALVLAGIMYMGASGRVLSIITGAMLIIGAIGLGLVTLVT